MICGAPVPWKRQPARETGNCQPRTGGYGRAKLLRTGGRTAQIRHRPDAHSHEAEHFLKISQDLENGGEVAHSDAIKAQFNSTIGSADCRKHTWPWRMRGWRWR